MSTARPGVVDFLLFLVCTVVCDPLRLWRWWFRWHEPPQGYKRPLGRSFGIVRVGQWRARVTEKAELARIFQVTLVDEASRFVEYRYLNGGRGRWRLRHVEQHSTLLPPVFEAMEPGEVR